MTAELKERPRVETLTIGVGGMTCASCVARVERALKKVPGVGEATVNLATEKATVSFDALTCEVGSLLEAVDKAGYDPKSETLVFDIESSLDPQSITALEQVLLAIAGVVAVNIDAAARRVTVSYPAGAVDAKQLRLAASKMGVELVERRAEVVGAPEAEREHELSALRLKSVVAGIAGASLMGAGFWREWDVTRDLIPVQEMLTLMFIVTAYVLPWAGSQFYTTAWKGCDTAAPT